MGFFHLPNKRDRMSIDDFDFAHEDATDDTPMLERATKEAGPWWVGETCAIFLLTHVSTTCTKMRKRSDTSKTSVTQRSATRNSAAARRGEDRFAQAGKEQNKTPPSGTKAAEEKAPEPIREIVSPRRSSSKRETSAVLETSQLRIAAPLPVAPAFSENLQEKVEALEKSLPAETTPEGTSKQAASLESLPEEIGRVALPEEVCTGQLEKQATPAEAPKSPDKQSPTVLEAMKVHVSSAPTSSEGIEKQVSSAPTSTTNPVQAETITEATVKMFLADPVRADSGAETIPRASLLGMSEAGGQTDVSGAGKPDLPDTGKLDDISVAKEHGLPEAGDSDLNKAGDVGTRQSISEITMEIPTSDLVQAAPDGHIVEDAGVMDKDDDLPEDDSQSNQQNFDSKIQTEKVEITAPILLEGGQEVVPLEELSASPTQLKRTEDEAKHKFLSTSVAQESLPSKGYIEPIAAAETAALTESIQGRAATYNMLANIPLGRVGASSFSSSAVGVDRTTDKDSNLNEASSFSYYKKEFPRNLVSSVEGETVLIVESLGVLPQATAKLEETVPGMCSE
ncbi:hypothetical protein L7F22_024908 [Adiantum nelumboides]|nr:hypothetical protein [Adiantum nelumboides]